MGLIRENKESIRAENLERELQARIFTGMENSDLHKDQKKQIRKKTIVVSEPGVVYLKETNSKKIIFSSVHDQEQDNYLYWLSLAPEQRLASVTQLIMEIFAEELKKPRASNRILFDSL